MGLLGLVLALTGSCVGLAVVSTLARLFVYAASIAALPGAGRRRGRPSGFGTFLMICAALIVCLWADLQSDWPAWRMLGLMVVAGCLLYAAPGTGGGRKPLPSLVPSPRSTPPRSRTEDSGGSGGEG